MASIILENADRKGNYLPLGKRISVIGRLESLPLQVLDDQVSRKHLRIRFEEASGHYLAADLNSRNGVFVNGRKIEEETQLREGDIMRIGNTELLFTEKDFDDAQSALHHFKKAGERSRQTMTEKKPPAP